MKTKWVVAGWVCWSLLACAGPRPQMDRDQLFREVVSSMPAYEDFLTVDELHGALVGLWDEHPELVSVQLVTSLYAMDHVQHRTEFAAR